MLCFFGTPFEILLTENNDKRDRMLIRQLTTEQHPKAQLKSKKRREVIAIKLSKCGQSLPPHIGKSSAASPMDEMRLWFGI